MGELMRLFEADYHSHNFLSARGIMVCGVDKKLDFADVVQN
jgi:hypothetical protein